MPVRNAATAAAALLASSLALCACASSPTLTLSGRTSLRSRKNGTAHAQLWTAGMALGWSSVAIARGFADEPEPDATPQPDAEAPCAFDATCDWEAQQRDTAYARLGAFESEEP
jgi:hypothetical protein